MFSQSPVRTGQSGARASLSEVRHRLDESFEAAIKVDLDDGEGDYGVQTGIPAHVQKNIPILYVADVLRLPSAIFVCRMRTAPSWIRLATLVRTMYGTVASDCNSAEFRQLTFSQNAVRSCLQTCSSRG